MTHRRDRGQTEDRQWTDRGQTGDRQKIDRGEGNPLTEKIR